MLTAAGGAGRGGAVSGLTDNLAAKQSPAVSCGDQRAVHFTPPSTCQAHMPPNMCLCVQETLPDMVTPLTSAVPNKHCITSLQVAMEFRMPVP